MDKRLIKPRYISIVTDPTGWLYQYAALLVEKINNLGDQCALVTDYDSIKEGYAAFYLGCTKITPSNILKRNQYNLVVHESDLPIGRGFAPIAWSIIEGADEITVCLIEAVEDADAGPIYLRTKIALNGTELNGELRRLQAEATLSLCLKFLESSALPAAQAQLGKSTWRRRRRPADSRLDPTQSLADQFDLMRTVDNDRYPAFFEFRGRRYRLAINDDGPAEVVGNLDD